MLESCLTASELKCLCVGVRWGPFCLYLRLLGFKHHLCIITGAVMKATLHKTLEDERAHGGRDTVDDQSTFLHRTKSLAEETDMLWFSFYFSSAPRYSGHPEYILVFRSVSTAVVPVFRHWGLCWWNLAEPNSSEGLEAEQWAVPEGMERLYTPAYLNFCLSM